MLCNVLMPQGVGFSHIYHTPAPGGNDFWQKTKEVGIHPIIVVKDEEFHQLDGEPHNYPELEKISPFLPTLKRRATKQAKQFLQKSDLPPQQHQGPVYRYLLGTADDRAVPSKQGAPIIVRGTPVTLPPSTNLDQDITQPTAVTSSQSLYRTNQKFVPVAPHPTTTHGKTPTPTTSPGISGNPVAKSSRQTTPPAGR